MDSNFSKLTFANLILNHHFMIFGARMYPHVTQSAPSENHSQTENIHHRFPFPPGMEHLLSRIILEPKMYLEPVILHPTNNYLAPHMDKSPLDTSHGTSLFQSHSQTQNVRYDR